MPLGFDPTGGNRFSEKDMRQQGDLEHVWSGLPDHALDPDGVLIRIRLSGHQFQDDGRSLCCSTRCQKLPLVGDLEQQLALPKILGFHGKRLGFLGTLLAFIWAHDAV
jgi:hypothetical protein